MPFVSSAADDDIDFPPRADDAASEREEEVRVEVGEVESRDYSAYEVAKTAKPMEWAVEGLVPARAQIVLAGPAKLGRKSMLAHWLIMCVSEGKPFLDCKTYRRPCIYCHLEGGFERAARRWKSFGEGRVEPLELDGCTRTVRFGIPGYERSLDALRQEQVLIIADPLVRVTAHRGIDENDPTEVTRFLYEHEELVNVGPGSVLFWLHHFRKAGDRMRGSTAYEAAVDGWFESFPTDDKDTLRIEVTLRDGESKVLGARFMVEADGTFAFDAVEPPARRSLQPERRSRGNGKSKSSESEPALYAADVDTLRFALAEAGPSPSGGWYNEPAKKLVPNRRRGDNLEDIAKLHGLSEKRVKAALPKLCTPGEVQYVRIVGGGRIVALAPTFAWREAQRRMGTDKLAKGED